MTPDPGETHMSPFVFPLEAPELDVRARKARSIVIATDGREQSDPALIAGRMLADDHSASIRVATVVRALPSLSADTHALPTPDRDAARWTAQKKAVAAQMQRVWPGDATFDVEVYDGDAATRIAALAHETNASIIVAGLGRHRVMDRLFGDETALRLMRLADVPVLAVAPGLRAPPRRIVAAIDFSETGLQAARSAIELAGREAILHLVHVVPREATYDADGSSYREEASYLLQTLRSHLAVPHDMTVYATMLHGDPATELLAFATNLRADLIASGSHGHGFVARMLIGSVTTRLLRCATCSVLAVPHGAVADTRSAHDDGG
jgi:nucleotide-binding universal stress UspA family protein